MRRSLIGKYVFHAEGEGAIGKVVGSYRRHGEEVYSVVWDTLNGIYHQYPREHLRVISRARLHHLDPLSFDEHVKEVLWNRQWEMKRWTEPASSNWS